MGICKIKSQKLLPKFQMNGCVNSLFSLKNSEWGQGSKGSAAIITQHS